MPIFIKQGTLDKVAKKQLEGGGFMMVEILVTEDLKLTEPDFEARKYWIKLKPDYVRE